MAGNAQTVYRFLVGKGLTPAQAAGVVGGLSGESGTGLSTTARNPSSGAYGIGQWLGGRKSALLAQKNPSSLSTQLNYLWSELQGSESGAYKALKGAKTVDDATRAWVSQFERPEASGYHLDTRSAFGRQVLKQFGGQSGISSVPGSSSGGGGSVTVSAGGGEVPQQVQGSEGAAALLQALAQQRPQPVQASGIAPPAFAAGPRMPKGYAPVQTSAPPQQPVSISALASLIQPSDTSPVQTQQGGTVSNTVSVGGSAPASGGGARYAGGTPVGVNGKEKVIGTPYAGTHTLGNWQSDNAVDIAVPVGTPMVALQNGTIVKVVRHPQGSGRFAGDQITVRGANGNEYFYAHGVAHVKAGQKIQKGQVLGTTGSANGVAHLHFGQMKGDPRMHVR